MKSNNRPKSDGSRGYPARGFSVSGDNRKKKTFKKQTYINEGTIIFFGMMLVALIYISIWIFNFYYGF